MEITDINILRLFTKTPQAPKKTIIRSAFKRFNIKKQTNTPSA